LPACAANIIIPLRRSVTLQRRDGVGERKCRERVQGERDGDTGKKKEREGK